MIKIWSWNETCLASLQMYFPFYFSNANKRHHRICTAHFPKTSFNKHISIWVSPLYPIILKYTDTPKLVSSYAQAATPYHTPSNRFTLQTSTPILPSPSSSGVNLISWKTYPPPPPTREVWQILIYVSHRFLSLKNQVSFTAKLFSYNRRLEIIFCWHVTCNSFQLPLHN